MTRSYDRAPDQARPASCVGDFVPPATGSALITIGATQVICTASVEPGVPRWMSGTGRGWVTAEYGMLPASTGSRKPRDSTRLHPDGRTVEIQRLIGRALRGIVDFAALGERTVHLDCDVLVADGGLTAGFRMSDWEAVVEHDGPRPPRTPGPRPTGGAA